MRIPPFLLLLPLLLLQGCAYAISSGVADRADRTIPFKDLVKDPQAYTGKTVILGGAIGWTKPLKTGTLIEVAQKELDYWGKPRRTTRTGGHFLVIHPSRLDPMVYAPGREVTVAGELIVPSAEAIGGEDAGGPVLRTVEFKLWPVERMGWDKPSFLDPLNDPHTQEGRFGY